MLVICTLLLAVLSASASDDPEPGSVVSFKIPESETSTLETCQDLKRDAAQIRNEGYSAINTANSIREQAYRAKEEALELKEEALEVRENAASARSALESRLVETLVDTFALMRSQATVTDLYIKEIRGTLNAVKSRMDIIEEKLETQDSNDKGREELIRDLRDMMDKKMTAMEETISAQQGVLRESLADQTTALEEQTAALEEQAATTTSISREVSNTLATAMTMKNRQQTLLSEVRLISLYKDSGQTSTHSSYGHEAELISDGQFIFDRHHWGDMATYSHTGSAGHNNKIWLKLGGLFRIHKIKIWNMRHCCSERIVGSRVLADDKLIGSIVRAQSSYDFEMAVDDPTYAREITLHQPLAQWLSILELQVWGSGPFTAEDKFA